MNIHQFGEVDGNPVFEVSIGSAGGAQAPVITWGAVLRDLTVPSPPRPRRVVLGVEQMPAYLAPPPHFGANVGRFAHRISHRHFTLDGGDHLLQLNQGRKTP